MVAVGCRIRKPYEIKENKETGETELVEGEVVAQFEIGNPEWVGHIKFAHNKVILKSEEKAVDGLTMSQTVPIPEGYVLETKSDGKPVANQFKSKSNYQQRSRAF